MSTTQPQISLPETAPAPTGTTGTVPSRRGRFRSFLAPHPVRWRTVLTLAVLLAYADGFWLTSVQGAVGAIERAQSPFVLWLESATLMLPLHVLAVLVALGVARRRLGGLRTGKQVVAAGLLVILTVTLLATGEVLVNAVFDYRLQALQVQFMHSLHAHGSSLSRQLQLTQQADDAGARFAVVADLVTNAVLVAWVLAAQGGRLVLPVRRRRRACRCRAPRRCDRAVPPGLPRSGAAGKSTRGSAEGLVSSR